MKIRILLEVELEYSSSADTWLYNAGIVADQLASRMRGGATHVSLPLLRVDFIRAERLTTAYVDFLELKKEEQLKVAGAITRLNE